jgi:hypothetical protein
LKRKDTISTSKERLRKLVHVKRSDRGFIDDSLSSKSISQLSLGKIIDRIISLNFGLEKFWSSSYGWSSIESANLLSRSRLDWQVSLSKQLKYFARKDRVDEAGKLILGWALLGSLVEGTMKLFLSVWYKDYIKEEYKEDLKGIIFRWGTLTEPDELMLNSLRRYFEMRVYPIETREEWKEDGEIDWLGWVKKIQNRRNAIHAYKDREIGTLKEYAEDVGIYLLFLRKFTQDLPYPEDHYRPCEF